MLRTIAYYRVGARPGLPRHSPAPPHPAPVAVALPDGVRRSDRPRGVGPKQVRIDFESRRVADHRRILRERREKAPLRPNDGRRGA